MSKEAHDAQQLHAVLTALLGRRVTNKEIWDALGIGKTRYYEIVREDSSQLLRADRLIDAARHMGINPVELLVKLGELDTREASDYVNEKMDALKRDMEDMGADVRPLAVLTEERRKTKRPPKLSRRSDAPPL
jgi:hypothetical protein